MRINNNNPLTHAVLAVTLLSWATLANALTSDKEQPIQVNADTVSIDESKDMSTYTGNVVVTQGSLRITGDVMKIYGVTTDLNKIIVTGKPVHFRQRPDNKKQDIRGEGRQLHYFSKTEEIHLLDKAKLWQSGNTIKSKKIIYDTQKAVMKAGTTKGKNRGRVITVFQPKKKK